MRESEAQTIPAALPDDPSKIKVDGGFQEILELKDFSYGHGLPVDMYEIELIIKAREKRAFNDALPPLSDEANFNLRNKLTNEGIAVVLISSDMMEIIGMANRIMVFYEGNFIGELPGYNVTQEKIMQYASGYAD